ncbi:hypothetical protein BDV96DRAFT_503571, partial [Lophiotrema nucula]
KMPNVGKPSKGCKNCRDRKVKCDLKRPSCTQCLRIGKECHGYRDPLTMMFRNESDVVARKAKMRYQELSKAKEQKLPHRAVACGNQLSESESCTSSPSSSSDIDYQLVPAQQYVRPGSVVWEMMPSLEDQGVSFFYSNYVQPPKFIPRGQFDFLIDVMNKPDTKKIVQSSVTAAGLAGLANSTKCQVVMKRAQEEYVSALSMVNRALQVPDSAKTDDTLISVIMLGMYENFMYQGKDPMTAWARHVNGACALMAMRGPDLFKGTIGTRIMAQYYGTILLVALERGTPVPAGMAELWRTGAASRDYRASGKEWTTQLVMFMTKAINLSQFPGSLVDKVALATKFDRELDEVKTLLPNTWLYEKVYLDDPVEFIYGNCYHIYLDPWIAQMWNNLRIIRASLHGSICDSVFKGLKSNPPLFSKSEAQALLKISLAYLRRAQNGICASTPQITGQIPFPDPPPATQISAFTSLADQINPLDPKFKLQPPGTYLGGGRASPGMHHLIWPLYTCGRIHPCPKELQEWIIDRLYFIALKMGTRQATYLAEELKNLSPRSPLPDFLDLPQIVEHDPIRWS